MKLATSAKWEDIGDRSYLCTPGALEYARVWNHGEHGREVFGFGTIACGHIGFSDTMEEAKSKAEQSLRDIVFDITALLGASK